jgi:hypothetical protein
VKSVSTTAPLSLPEPFPPAPEFTPDVGLDEGSTKKERMSVCPNPLLSIKLRACCPQLESRKQVPSDSWLNECHYENP